jgi:hypothetical protein
MPSAQRQANNDRDALDQHQHRGGCAPQKRRNGIRMKYIQFVARFPCTARLVSGRSHY